MRKRKNREFDSSEEAFRAYIPDFVPEQVENAEIDRSDEETLVESELTNYLLGEFNKVISNS